MAGSWVGVWAPLPCLTPSVSGRASEQAGCLDGWRKKEWRRRAEERRGRSKILELRFWGQGTEAAPPGSLVTANDAEPKERGVGGLLNTVKMCVKGKKDRKTEHVYFILFGVCDSQLTVHFVTPLKPVLFPFPCYTTHTPTPSAIPLILFAAVPGSCTLCLQLAWRCCSGKAER